MAGPELYKRGIQDALELSRRLKGSVEREIRATNGRLSKVRGQEKAATQHLAKARETGIVIAALLAVPLMSRPLKRQLASRVATAEALVRSRRKEASRLRRRAEERSEFLKSVVSQEKRLGTLAAPQADLEHLPRELLQTLAFASNSARHFRASSRKPREDRLLACITSMAAAAEQVLKHVAARTAKAPSGVASTVGGRPRPLPRSIDEARKAATGPLPSIKSAGSPASERERAALLARRIYLPVSTNRMMVSLARRAGAKQDEGADGSQMYATGNQDWGPLESYLPLAFRQKRTIFDFPPIPSNAVGHNLHTVFTEESWRRISVSSHDSVGYRCQICGGQRGQLLALRSKKRHPNALVDCHEVWDWDIPEVEHSVGIQRLRTLLVVCFDCHMMFHEDVALSFAQKRGREDDVRKFLDQRRRFTNRMTTQQMSALMERGAAQWNRAQQMDHWILDLSHLASQNHLRHFELVLVEGNKAGIQPGDVAGVDFVTDSGRRYGARSAEDIYEEIVDARRLRGSRMR